MVFKALSLLIVATLAISAAVIQPPLDAEAGGRNVYLNGSGGSDSAGAPASLMQLVRSERQRNLREMTEKSWYAEPFPCQAIRHGHCPAE